MESSRVPDDAVVIRGGRSDAQLMADAVERNRGKLIAKGEEPRNVLSVFTDSEGDAEAVIQKGQKLLKRWSLYRETTAGTLRALGYEVGPPDSIGHATLELSEEMTDDDYAKIDAELGDVRDNPVYKRRKRRG